ncbi:hypothetical protein PV327_007431 [Microctonus hyperodae]|uniref:Uncharacterized protein n=1 Tax=Microctonus hyperodae TaxID=165561 RepID=A0AA39FZ62_MICHY|nr:hypothetical protein PV327_007431 [Microctonus hyperodae]
MFYPSNINLRKPRAINELSSDHLPVITYINPNNYTNQSKNLKRDYNKTNWSLYREKLNNNWNMVKEFNNNTDIDSTLNKLTDTMNKTLETVTPKWNNVNKFKNIDNKIILLIRERNNIRKHVQRNKCSTFKNEMNILSNRIKYELYKHKNEQYNKYLKSLEIRNGSLWNTVRFVKFIKGVKNSNIQKLHGPNGIVYSNKDKADVFADYFESVYSITEDFGSNSHNKIINKEYNKIIHNENNDDNQYKRTYSRDIKSVISKLKNKKAPGIDGISNL